MRRVIVETTTESHDMTTRRYLCSYAVLLEIMKEMFRAILRNDLQPGNKRNQTATVTSLVL